MTNSTLTLIPSTHFEVRNLKGLKLQVSKNEYIILSGWGIYDIQASAYVRFADSKIKSSTDDRSIESPYHLKSKKWAVEACQDGLYEGYLTIAI